MNKIIGNNISKLKKIGKNHKVKRMYAFGSVCTENFNDNSDIDFIIAFEKRYFENYVENFFALEDELKQLFKRKIDLVVEETIQNPFFINVINRTKTPIYE